MAFSDALSGVTDWDEKLWDYLRYFHLNKPINPDTGRRNPTVTNHSWGYNQGTIYMTSVNSVYYRGTSVTITGTLAQNSVFELMDIHQDMRIKMVLSILTEFLLELLQ